MTPTSMLGFDPLSDVAQDTQQRTDKLSQCVLDLDLESKT